MTSCKSGIFGATVQTLIDAVNTDRCMFMQFVDLVSFRLALLKQAGRSLSVHEEEGMVGRLTRGGFRGGGGHQVHVHPPFE